MILKITLLALTHCVRSYRHTPIKFPRLQDYATYVSILIPIALSYIQTFLTPIDYTLSLSAEVGQLRWLRVR